MLQKFYRVCGVKGEENCPSPMTMLAPSTAFPPGSAAPRDLLLPALELLLS